MRGGYSRSSIGLRAGRVIMEGVTDVAVLGMGGMGSRIALRLLDAGNAVTVWNRSPARTEPLVAAGAKAASTPADAAASAEVVLTMLADPAALGEVTEGGEGVAAGVTERTTVIEMSTVGPEAIARLRDDLPDGTRLLDAPVLGSLTEVEAGTLRIFVGGADEDVARWTPLLAQLGTPMHIGPLGSGAAAKLVANTALVGIVGVLGEALALAGAVGLERSTALDVLATTALASQVERRRAAIESGDYPPRFPLALGRKDADLIVEAATAGGTELRVLDAARSWLADAEAAGWGERDYAAVLAYIVDVARSEDRRPTTD
jgi:3-hydroxyisobutyrate dehydrogenase